MDLQQWGPIIFWAVALAAFAVAEGLTVSLTSIWFALGALCALITAAFTDRILTQLIVFLIMSLLTLLLIRPLVRRHLSGRRVATNADRAVGEEAVVTEEIDNLNAKGQAAVNGAVWTARSENGEIVRAGERVRVLRIEGVKLIVSPLSQACADAAATREYSKRD